MKILAAKITDPRREGEYRDPYMTLTVDEPVYEQVDPVFDYKKHLQYRIIPCGPFYAVEYRPDLGMSYDPWVDVNEFKAADVGEVNSARIIDMQLFPVEVLTPEGELIDLFMDVSRARRMARKFNLDVRWNIQVDEQAALLGLLKWGLELRNPPCYGGAKPAQDRCALLPTSTIVYRETHLPLCENHLQDHQARMASARRRFAKK